MLRLKIDSTPDTKRLKLTDLLLAISIYRDISLDDEISLYRGKIRFNLSFA